MTHLVEGFEENFRVVHADSRELIEQSFALRYQVYCLEKAFETPTCFTDGRETDNYDERSVHSLVYHQGLGRYVGSVRLVLPDTHIPQSPFPIENLCGGLHRARLYLSDLDPGFRIAEISRFAISKLRRCGAESDIDDAPRHSIHSKTQDYGILPHATLGLFTAILRMSADNGISHWYALMEPTLSRLLSRFGIYFQSIGPKVRHRGMRQPVMGEVDKVVAQMYLERPDVWELVTDAGRSWPLNESLVAQLAQQRQADESRVAMAHGVSAGDGAGRWSDDAVGYRVKLYSRNNARATVV